MAGHSQFKNIMHRKGRQDAKRAKVFNKLAREIMVAAAQGVPDPAFNPRLRAAIAEARTHSLPKDRIDRAIASAQPGANDGKVYEQLRYEGFGPGRVAVILDILTDNRNRTAAEIRTLFSKNGGNLGETGSVAFMFQRVGRIVYPVSAGSADAVLEKAIEAGADDVQSDDETHTILTQPDDLMAVAGALEQGGLGEASEAKLAWIPSTTVTLDLETAQSVMKFMDLLDDHDDVQTVHANFEIPDDVMAQLDDAA